MLSLSAAAGWASAASVALISHGMDGGPALTGAASELPSVSADGKWVAFVSNAINFANVRKGVRNVFLRDLETGAVELVSQSASGQPADADSFTAVVSGDDRYVAFGLYTANLVRGDTNRVSDIFARDRTLALTERVSVSSNEVQGDSYSLYGSISADGRYVAIVSAAENPEFPVPNYSEGIYVRDRTQGTTQRVDLSSEGDPADQQSHRPSISADGRYVAFTSSAGNLVPDDSNQHGDAFIWERLSETTERVNVATGGAQGNDDTSNGAVLSSNGRRVVVASSSSNLAAGDTSGRIDVFVRDRVAQTTVRVSESGTGNRIPPPHEGRGGGCAAGPTRPAHRNESRGRFRILDPDLLDGHQRQRDRLLA